METQEIVQQLSKLDTKVAVAIVAGIASIVVSFLSFLNQRKAVKIQENTLNRANANYEITNLKRELEEFYLPFKHMMDMNFRYYEIIRHGLPSDFRLLFYLIDNEYEFTKADGTKSKIELDVKKGTFIEKIFDTNIKMQALILEKGAIVRDAVLTESYTPNSEFTDVLFAPDPDRPPQLNQNKNLFSLFQFHGELLQLAKTGKLDKTKINEYTQFVYPRELNNVINTNIDSIKKRIFTLESN